MVIKKSDSFKKASFHKGYIQRVSLQKDDINVCFTIRHYTVLHTACNCVDIQ